MSLFHTLQTKVQNANRPEVWLHTMDAKLMSSQAINWSLEKTMMTVKSLPKNVKVDNTLVVFDECQGGPYTYQPFATKVKDSKLLSNCCQLLIEEDCHYERNEILSGTMWYNILSTSANLINSTDVSTRGFPLPWVSNNDNNRQATTLPVCIIALLCGALCGNSSIVPDESITMWWLW